jgi:putative peptidoglycan lipid II flippase
MVLNIILVFPLAHAGLALATSLSATLNALLLFRGLRNAEVYRPQSGWLLLILRGAMASALMGIALLWGVGELQEWVTMARWDRIQLLLGLILAGAGVYFSTLWLLGIRLRHFRSSADIS